MIVILICCKFHLKEYGPPWPVVRDLVEIAYLLRENDDYNFGFGEHSFRISIFDYKPDFEENLFGLLSENKLSYRHLRAYFWLKRHTVYEGYSHNPMDLDMHPDDFFAEVDRILREFFNKDMKG